MPKSYCHLSDLERAQIPAHLELGSKVHQPRARAQRLHRPPNYASEASTATDAKRLTNAPAF